MLSRKYLCEALVGAIPGIENADSQILEAQGLDAVMELVTNLRSVAFPVVILEGRSSGSIQLIEGPVDFYTESIWIMDRVGRGESESDTYLKTRLLAIRILAKLLDDAKRGEPCLCGFDWRRTTYMKRYGGPEARGWELVLSFTDNISLLLDNG